MMGLLQNGYRHNLTGKIVGATNIDGANPYAQHYRGHITSRNRNILAGSGITDSKAAIPNGNLPSSSWVMPRKAGGMSSRSCYVAIDGAANGLMGMPATGASYISISFDTVSGELIASGIGTAAISISGDTSQIIASLSAIGSTTFSIVGTDSLLGALAESTGTSSFTISAVSDILPEDDSPVERTASSAFSFSGSLSPYAVGVLGGEAFLAGGTIDEFAVLGRMEYDNAVHIDATNGSSGTKNPIGTLASPVNNITDALTIARGLNLTKIKFLSDYTLSAGDNVSGYTLVSDSWKVLTVETGAATTDTVFERLSLYGELCGTWNTLIDCWTYDITNFLGWVRGGSIERVELAPYLNPDPFSLGSSYFDDIVPMYADIKSVLVMNTAVSVSFTNCTDIVEIHNMEEGEVINIALSGGQVIIDSTCTGGEIHISGVGVLEDNSSGPVVNSVGLLNDLEFIIKTITNKREIKEESNRTTLIIYDDNGVTPILQKVLKDISGERISALAAGTLAREEAMSI